MKKKNQQPVVKDLHLWIVKHSGHAHDDHFWITTKKECAIDAIRKAKRLLPYATAKIREVKYAGFIDA